MSLDLQELFKPPLNPSTPMQWIEVGNQRAADAIAIQSKRKNSVGAFYLAGYAIECSLKAYLLARRRPLPTREMINISSKTTTARGSRYLTLEDLERQVAAGLLTVLEEQRDRDGSLKKVKVESTRYVESDTSLINRVIGPRGRGQAEYPRTQ
jgi:hypothetical protein